MASVEKPQLAYSEIRYWPDGNLTALEKAGVLCRLSDAEHVLCDQCSSQHVERVLEHKLEKGVSSHFIICPDAGQVSVAVEQRRQWRIDFDELAVMVAQTLGANDDIETIAAGTAWRLGTLFINDRCLSVLLLRRFPRSQSVKWESNGVNTSESVLLTLGLVSEEASDAGFAGVLPLNRLLRFRENKLKAIVGRLESAVLTRPAEFEIPRTDVSTMTVAYRGKKCRFSSRAKQQFNLLQRLCRRPGHHVPFRDLCNDRDIFAAYGVSNDAIRSALSRLRVGLKKQGLSRLARCVISSTAEGDQYAVLDLSVHSTKSH